MTNPFREIHTREIELPATTEGMQAAQPDVIRVFARIRSVLAGQITAETGIPPRMMNIQRQRDPNLSDDEWNAQIQDQMSDDPELMAQMLKMTEAQHTWTLRLGTSELVIEREPKKGTKPLLETYTLNDADPNGIHPSDLGSDKAILHDAIVEFSSLNVPLLGKGVATFPAQQAGDPGEPDGEILRDDTSEAAAG